MSMGGGSQWETEATMKKCEQCGEFAIERPSIARYCDECETLRTITRLSTRVKELEPAVDLLAKLVADPWGCGYCDSGTLRRTADWMRARFPDHPFREPAHAPDCLYLAAQQLLAKVRP
jgi:hypothetical protein